MFEKIALVGIGLIGSSIALAVKKHGLAQHIAISTRKSTTLDEAKELGLGDSYSLDACEAVRDADLIILCAPVGAFENIIKTIAPFLKPGAILSDVGSVKGHVQKIIGPLVPEGVHFVPGHPMAGTEYSGPAAGFPSLFEGRWCILTPRSDVDLEAVSTIGSASCRERV